ncbi:MAG: diphosphomevalonate decarboxylase [Flavobacteriales bacterium]|jgi:diphosphomevalonate decarboxylase|nr:diphosphomevalonate decarboxylase [Flavobacteriales bacterium]
MVEARYIFNQEDKELERGEVTWKSPSNIALVKYWGKKENQIPANPSISFTLSNCYTLTTIKYEPSTSLAFKVFVDGKREEGFEPKIATFFKRIEKYVPFINRLKLEIHTQNTFPHSSGIASSASGLSALALCVLSIERALSSSMEASFFKEKASFLARLGSGSACRSVYPELVVWGENKSFRGSSDLVAVPFDGAHEVFKDFQDTILLVDKGQKVVSSTVGHDLMHGHPFSAQRFSQAHENMEQLKLALKEGDLKTFTQLVESEALTLHAMMMTSNPYFILMKPNTLKIIEKVWEYRAKHDLNLTITLDAGANVHLLYPKSETAQAMELIKGTLVDFCENKGYICDEVGTGSEEIVN